MNRSYCIALKGGLDLPLEHLVLRVVYDIAHTDYVQILGILVGR